MLLAALALSLQPAPPPAAEVQSEIVIIGNKLKKWRARVGERDGRMFCRTQKSSGDRDIDAIGCSAMAGCTVEHRARIIASTNRKLPDAQRKALTDAAYKEVTKCVFSRRDALIADLAERRLEARQGTN